MKIEQILVISHEDCDKDILERIYKHGFILITKGIFVDTLDHTIVENLFFIQKLAKKFPKLKEAGCIRIIQAISNNDLTPLF